MGTTRREFLARSGAVAGAALVAGGALALPGGAAPAAGLTEARRGTFAALAEAVVTGPSMRLEPAAAQVALEAFVGVYDTWPADQRQRADRTLDDLAAAPAAVVSGAGRPPRLRSPSPVGAERRALALREASLDLVAAVVGPPGVGHDLGVI